MKGLCGELLFRSHLALFVPLMHLFTSDKPFCDKQCGHWRCATLDKPSFQVIIQSIEGLNQFLDGWEGRGSGKREHNGSKR